MATGERVKQFRMRAGLTQADLAKRLNVSRQQVAKWESGIRNPKIDNLRKIGDALSLNREERLDLIGMTQGKEESH